MKEFIIVHDALTGKFMLIRTSMICTIEDTYRNEMSVRRLTYVDGRPEEYISDTLVELMSDLGLDQE